MADKGASGMSFGDVWPFIVMIGGFAVGVVLVSRLARWMSNR